MGWEWRPQTWQQDRPGLALLHRKHAGGAPGPERGLPGHMRCTAPGQGGSGSRSISWATFP
jgi:hypothetical protein